MSTLWIELSASFFTLAGMAIGSTTNHGAMCYVVGFVFWFWLMKRKALWGLIPLNVIGTIVSLTNLLLAKS